MTGDEDDGNPDARVSQLLLKVQTVDSRNAHVENQATWAVRSLAVQDLFCRPEGFGPQAHRHQALDRRAHSRIVIDDERSKRVFKSLQVSFLGSVLVGRVK